MLKELDQDNPVTPAEKPTLRKTRSTKKIKKCCNLCICKCPVLTSCSRKPNPPMARVDSNFKPKICPQLGRQFCDQGVELVPLLARRRAQNRPISLSSTDVTKNAIPETRYDNLKKFTLHIR